MIRWSHPQRDVALPAPLREQAVERESIQAGASTANLERLTLPDGARVVAKHVSARRDWMMRATGDTGRAAELWVGGAMRRCPATIDPALVRIEDDGEGGWFLYMQEVPFHRRDVRFQADDVARLLGALADLHTAFWGDPPPGLCSLSDLFTILRPDRIVGADPAFAALVRGGWERFAEVAPVDVAEAVTALLAEPAPVVAALERHGTTLLHADVHFGNAVLLPDRLVLVDWTLASAGPPAVDFTWFLDQSCSYLDVDHDDAVELFLAAEGGRVDEDLLDIACVGQLLNSGWQVHEWLDAEAARPVQEQNFDWFVKHARRGLELL
jgi:hypothetical protein